MNDCVAVEGAGGYALYHSLGIYPGKAADLKAELTLHAERWCASDGTQWAYAEGIWSEFLGHWSRLINAPARTLASTQNVTASLYSFLGSLPPDWLQGKRVLIDGDCFPSMYFLLDRLSERMGFTLVRADVRPGQDYVRDKDVIDAWNEDVALALLTWVTSVSSRKCNLERLVEHGRRMGSLIGVDTTQAIGIAPYDVREPRVDFMIASSLKWLCGVPGAGVLYVHESLIPKCRPEFCGWFSHESPFNWNLDEFRYAPDIGRFGHGTPSVIPYAACLPGLRWHKSQGVENLRAWNLELTERLFDAGEQAGWDIVTPRDRESRGGSVMVRLPNARARADVLGAFHARNCAVDNRDQTIRISPGAVTTTEGVDVITEVLNEQLG